MKKNNKNNNHKILNKNYIKGAISGALALDVYKRQEQVRFLQYS